MREIEFRGLDPKSGEFVKGDLIHGVGNKCGKVFILPIRINLAYVKNCDPLDGVEVDPKSVGQFTGLLDKNGKKIFEGDVLQSECTKVLKSEIDDDLFKIPNIEKRIYNNVIDWYNGVRVSGWRIKGKGFQSQLKWSTVLNMNLEIIGNVHENPELLK